MVDILRPGYNEHELIQTPTPWIAEDTIAFMMESGVPKGATVVDIGPESYKSKRMGEYWNVVHADADDFNFDYPEYSKDYGPIRDRTIDYVTCFEIIEHLQNPYMLLDYIQHILKKEGRLFLSTPARPRFLWPDFHYNEMSPAHIQKWLLTPLGMEIVRKKKIRINNPKDWTFYIGFRPFLRLFFNYTWIYEIRKK